MDAISTIALEAIDCSLSATCRVSGTVRVEIDCVLCRNSPILLNLDYDLSQQLSRIKRA